MKIVSKSVSDTIGIGKTIAKALKPADIICLFGEFGTGKTVLTKGIAAGLGNKEDDVTSPSFVLIRQHLKGRLVLSHFDLYRLKRPEDILVLGYEDYLYGQGVSIVEWADRLDCLLPKEFLKIELALKKNSHRQFELQAFGSRYEELLKEIHENIRD